MAKRKPRKTTPPILSVAGRPATFNTRAPYAERRPLHVPNLGDHAAGCLDVIRAAMGKATGRDAGAVPASEAVRFALWYAADAVGHTPDNAGRWLEMYEAAARRGRQGGG